MTKEEKQQLEDKAKALRETADQAHQASTEAPEDETLQTAAVTAEEAAVKAQEEAEAATVDPLPSEEEEEEDDEEDIDFDKELENLGGTKPKKTDLEKAERALHFNAEQVRRLGGDPTKILKPKKEEETPPAPPVKLPDDNKFVTQDDLNKRDLLAEIRKLAKTDAEYQVLVHHAENSIKLTGDPVKDAENAYLIAHKGKIKRSFEEIRRAGYSRPAPGSPPGRRLPAQPNAAPQLTPDEQNSLKRRGFVPQADGSWVGRKNTMRYDSVKKGWITERNK